MASYDWSVIHGTMLILMGKCIMGDHIEGFHDCPRVPVMHSVMIASLVFVVTWSKCFDHVLVDA